MTNRKPNFIYKFDGKHYSEEEQAYLIFRFVQVLKRIDEKQKLKKFDDLKKSQNRHTVE